MINTLPHDVNQPPQKLKQIYPNLRTLFGKSGVVWMHKAATFVSLLKLRHSWGKSGVGLMLRQPPSKFESKQQQIHVGTFITYQDISIASFILPFNQNKSRLIIEPSFKWLGI